MNEQQQKGWDKFWKECWPKCRRIDKKKAAEQWSRIAPGMYDAIFAELARQKKQPSWNTGDCKFIPHPHRWLRDRRWEDEIALPEDKDAAILIEALCKESSVPAGFPKHIMVRFRKMCMRLRTNWPELYIYLQRMEDEAEVYIRKEYLSTE